MSNYRKELLRTANHDFESIKGRFQEAKILLTNAALGLTGEAGEFADLMKKFVFHGRTIADVHEKAVLELGDIRWYLELAAYALGVTMEEIEQKNVEKLRARYPDGFSPAASAARVDVAPKTTYPNCTDCGQEMKLTKFGPDCDCHAPELETAADHVLNRD